MRYTEARAILSEAIEQLGEGRKTFAQRSASLIGRMGGSPEEVRQGITGKRTPAAKSGRALLTKAQKAAEKKRERDPDYPYGKAESRRMSKYMSESELDEATRKKPSKSSKPKKVKKVVGERPDQTDWNAVNAYQRKLHASDGIRGLAPTPWSLEEATRAKIARAAAHKAKFEKIRAGNKKYLERNKKRAAAEGGVGGILHKFRGFLGSSKSK